MIPLRVRRCWQTKRPFYVGILVCFVLLGLLPAGYGQTDNVSQLISQLKDPDAGVRRHAADALGEAKDPRAVEPLIASLKDPDAGVRRHAADALGEINSGEINSDDRSAAIDAWRVEMAYVKANRPVRVNGFLVGGGGGPWAPLC